MRRLVSALAAVALAVAPTASAMAQDEGQTPAGKDLPGENWDTGIVISVAALAILFALVLILGTDDDDEQSVSP